MSNQEAKRTEERTETHACDYISRQAAIDELDRGAWGAEWDKALAQAMIESLPSTQQGRRWIPCSERLPDAHRTYYLVSLANKKEVDIAYYTEYGTWETFRNDECIAWMPLPEPYKEEQE